MMADFRWVSGAAAAFRGWQAVKKANNTIHIVMPFFMAAKIAKIPEQMDRRSGCSMVFIDNAKRAYIMLMRPI